MTIDQLILISVVVIIVVALVCQTVENIMVAKYGKDKKDGK